MADRPKIYFDSCCFIDIAKGAVGSLPTSRSHDVWHSWKLLEASKNQEIDVITSVLTIAECTHADGNSDDKIRGLFTRLLTSGQYVRLVQPTLFVTADARDLKWKHGIAVRGADAMHIASAIFLHAAEFLTTDDKIMKQKVKITELGLPVLLPRETTCLPSHYRQDDLLNENVTTLRPGVEKRNS